MRNHACLKFLIQILTIHLMAGSIVYASPSSWAFQQVETAKAWELARGRGSQVVIAVVDTGIDTRHPDLKETLWLNPGESGFDRKGFEKSKNGIDDDQNGYIDDVHGWNFVSNTNDVMDTHGHGTHVAGIIAAQNRSGLGLQGIAPNSKLMILKYYDPKNSAQKNLQNTIEAFKYSIQMKAKIINFSGGGPGSNLQEESILKLAEKNKILLVAAAGNDGLNTDLQKYYPADYRLSNILSVTALNKNIKIPPYGNFGEKTVHLAAPGDQIFSTLPNGNYGEMSGTSQATAFATGAAALILSQNSDLRSPQQLIEKLTSSAVLEPALAGKTWLGSRLNARRALMMKSTSESAQGFVFENRDELDTQAFTISSSLWELKATSALDEKPVLRGGLRNATSTRSNSF